MLLTGQGQFVFHFRQSGDPDDYICLVGFDGVGSDPTLDATVLDYVAEAWEDSILTLQSIAILLSEVEMEVNDGGGVTGISSVRSTQGTRTGGSLIQNTAYLLHKLTVASGRGSQGRNYVPGCPEDKVNNVGVVDSGELVDLNSAAAAFLDACNSPEDIALVVNHKAGSPHGLSTLVNTMSFDPVVSSQRRRLRGRR